MTGIARAPEVDALISASAPVAIGVSGGKDSQAAALATFAYLDQVGHAGPRILIHSDLGSVEWKDSLPACERLAAYLRTELVVVRRAAGDLMERWEARWQSSVRRYCNLETVTLVLPWSTPALRFCTSELKTHIIAAELRRRFRGEVVINVTGVRHDESAARAKMPTASTSADGRSVSWRPIIHWSTADVFAHIAAAGCFPHPAYERGMSRVSCRYCIMSSEADLVAASAIAESHDLYRRMVALESTSTFAFQGARWLGDVAPSLLTDDQRANLAIAKLRGVARIAAEKRITKGMLYVKGWPTRMLTDTEAEILSEVRSLVGTIMEFTGMRCLDAPSIHARYAELMSTNEARRARVAA